MWKIPSHAQHRTLPPSLSVQGLNSPPTQGGNLPQPAVRTNTQIWSLTSWMTLDNVSMLQSATWKQIPFQITYSVIQLRRQFVSFFTGSHYQFQTSFSSYLIKILCNISPLQKTAHIEESQVRPKYIHQEDDGLASLDPSGLPGESDQRAALPDWQNWKTPNWDKLWPFLLTAH